MNTALSPQMQTIYTNGRIIKRIAVPRSVCYALGCILQESILRFNRKAPRRGTRTLQENCITGIAGQIACVLWLRYIGLPAAMLPIAIGPDPGFDIAITYDETEVAVRIEVKTSFFKDGRGSELVRAGDRLHISNGVDAEFVFWCVAAPTFFDCKLTPYVDIIATVPAGALNESVPAFSAVPGMRLLDIKPKFNTKWFAKQFDDARDLGREQLNFTAESTAALSEIMGDTSVKQLFHHEACDAVYNVDLLSSAQIRYSALQGSA